jgi:hypothetical protein
MRQWTGEPSEVRWQRLIRVQRDGLSIAANVNLAVNVNGRPVDVSAPSTSATKGDKMADEKGFKPLSRDELNQLAGEELPERAAMSLLNANVAIPINAAVAANVLSDNATSYADAAQTGQIGQTN